LTVGGKEQGKANSAPFLSKVRFGPGVLSMLATITLMGVVLYVWGHVYLAAAFGIIAVLLIGVKSMEIIQLSRLEQRQLVGGRCLVLNEVQKGKGGVVRVYDRKARLDPELWSAESEYSISAGQEAEVVGIRTVVLIIKPTQPVRPNGTSEFSET